MQHKVKETKHKACMLTGGILIRIIFCFIFSFFRNLEKAWKMDCTIDLEQLCNVIFEFLSNQANRETYIVYYSNFSHQTTQLQKLLER